jgi:hypothetical protein
MSEPVCRSGVPSFRLIKSHLHFISGAYSQSSLPITNGLHENNGPLDTRNQKHTFNTLPFTIPSFNQS